MKRLYLLPLFLGILMVGGCANSAAPTPKTGNPLQQMATAYLWAQAFDRVKIVLDGGSERQWQRAQGDLELLKRQAPRGVQLVVVSGLIDRANANLIEATGSSPSGADLLLASAGEKYRAALAFLPSDVARLRNEKELDADDLNALGYYLADKGTNQSDWERAEVLTRLATEQFDSQFAERIAKIKDPVDKRNFQVAVEMEKANRPRDSHAWALFKLGRLDEARAEQEDVVTILGSNRAKIKNYVVGAEVIFHLAEIYRMSGDSKKAFVFYREALALGPDAALEKKINFTLKLMSGDWRVV